jgi:alkaline phosphatase D
MRSCIFFIILLLGNVLVSAQNTTRVKANHVISGPMVGHVELRTAEIWMEFTSEVTDASVLWISKDPPGKAWPQARFSLTRGHVNVGKAVMTGLEPGKTYIYSIRINKNSQTVARGEVTTQELWQWRKPAPDFSFLTGSCSYFNEPAYDRPVPYGKDSSIFETMSKERASFMLWLGDNWYTRESDYYSQWGMAYRAHRDRSLKVLQRFWKAMPHYAIWDDHDYSWNNGDKSFPLKATSREVFKNYWCNPSYGEQGEGIYTKFTWNDIDLFLLDDRWFRSNDHLKDSLNGQPNPAKKMFGDQQMEWLKNALLNSTENPNVSFRIIATGSQVLNPMSPWDCFRHSPVEYNELMNFLNEYKINGIVFLTGDRHHSEIIKVDRAGNYPLYDITASSLTASPSKTSGVEKNNPYRVIPEITENNYARISITGPKAERKMTVEFLGLKGQKLGEWSVSLKDLSAPK